MARLVIDHSNEEYDLPDDSPLTEVCEQAGVPFACTEGVCGTCVIEVVEGMDHLSEYTEAESDFLGDMGNERLACQCKIRKGLVRIKF